MRGGERFEVGRGGERQGRLVPEVAVDGAPRGRAASGGPRLPAGPPPRGAAGAPPRPPGAPRPGAPFSRR